MDRLAARLREHGVGTVVLRHDVGAESLGRFLSAAALPPRVARAAGGLAGALAAAGASRVSIDGAWVQPAPALAAAAAAVQVRADGSPADPGIELWSAHDMYEQVRDSAVRVERRGHRGAAPPAARGDGLRAAGGAGAAGVPGPVLPERTG